LLTLLRFHPTTPHNATSAPPSSGTQIASAGEESEGTKDTKPSSILLSLYTGCVCNCQAMTVRQAADKDKAPVFVGNDGYPRRVRKSTVAAPNTANEIAVSLTASHHSAFDLIRISRFDSFKIVSFFTVCIRI